VVNQICFQVIGNDVTITMAAEAGQLQLNAMEPVIFFNLYRNIEILTRGCRVLTRSGSFTMFSAFSSAAETRCSTFEGGFATFSLSTITVPPVEGVAVNSMTQLGFNAPSAV
jgi:hypothetical protein